jgi:uncharacterized protein (TIGR02611 family)
MSGSPDANPSSIAAAFVRTSTRSGNVRSGPSVTGGENFRVTDEARPRTREKDGNHSPSLKSARAIGHTAHSTFGQIRNWFHATRAGRLVFRLIVGTLGLALVVVGLILVPLPGPGWLIVLAGFAVWAVEFAWARRLLHRARELLHRWNVWIKKQSWYIRAPILLAALAVVAVVAWLSFQQLFGFDPVERVIRMLSR